MQRPISCCCNDRNFLFLLSQLLPAATPSCPGQPYLLCTIPCQQSQLTVPCNRPMQPSHASRPMQPSWLSRTYRITIPVNQQSVPLAGHISCAFPHVCTEPHSMDRQAGRTLTHEGRQQLLAKHKGNWQHPVCRLSTAAMHRPLLICHRAEDAIQLRCQAAAACMKPVQPRASSLCSDRWHGACLANCSPTFVLQPAGCHFIIRVPAQGQTRSQVCHTPGL
jgi:hypothetical protein